MPTTPLRILLADDHEIVRKGLRSLLSNADWTICGEAADGDEAVLKAVELQPDLIILDLIMPKLSGIDAAKQIHDLVPSAKIIVLTSYDTRPIAAILTKAGVGIALSKSVPRAELIQAITTLVEQKTRCS